MNQTNFYALQIESWRGTSFGATHFYGTLHRFADERITPENVDGYNLDHFSENSIKVYKTLNKKEVIKLNKKDSYIGIPHEVGERTNRFDSISELVETAKEDYIRGSMEQLPFVVVLRGRLYEPDKD